jgi:hypothetical protein
MSLERARAILKGIFRGNSNEPDQDRPFQYQSLDPSKNEIRLLRILHAKDRVDPIRCEVFHTTLDDAGDYLALLYTWGDPNRTRPIQLNGHAARVTINLEEFLRQIRDPDWDYCGGVDRTSSTGWWTHWTSSLYR